MDQAPNIVAQKSLRTLRQRFFEYLLRPQNPAHSPFRIEIASEMILRREILLFGAFNQLLLIAPIYFLYDLTIALAITLVFGLTLLERYRLVGRCENIKELATEDAYRLMGSGLRYAGAVSLCASAVALSGNIDMLILAAFVTTGMVFGFCTLNAAAPRFAQLQIWLVAFPFLFCASISGQAERYILLMQTPVWIATIHVLVYALHKRVAQLVEARRDIRSLAYRDSLTGLANRARVMSTLDELASRTAGQTRAYMLYMDLDGFKAINDTHGHAVGDSLLQAVAHRLLHTVRPGDLVGRMGGDEFIVLLSDIETSEIPALAQRLTQAIAKPFTLSDTIEATVGLSIGGAYLNRDTAESLATADARLYATKRNRPGSYSLSGF